jgi:hypothetical protein
MIAPRADFLTYTLEETDGGPIRVAEPAQDGEKSALRNPRMTPEERAMAGQDTQRIILSSLLGGTFRR